MAGTAFDYKSHALKKHRLDMNLNGFSIGLVHLFGLLFFHATRIHGNQRSTPLTALRQLDNYSSVYEAGCKLDTVTQ